MNKLKSFWQETVKIIRQFPVEFAFGATMFVLMLVASVIGGTGGEKVSDAAKMFCTHVYNVAALSFSLLVVIYTLHKVLIYRQQGCRPGVPPSESDDKGYVCASKSTSASASTSTDTCSCTCISAWKIIYIASYFFFIPLLFIKLDNFIDSAAGYLAVTYLLSLLLLYLDLGSFNWSNERFVHKAVNLTIQGFFTVLIGGIIIAAFAVIVYSVSYIFDINTDVTNKIFANCASFVGLVVAPLLFCNFMSKRSAEMAGEETAEADKEADKSKEEVNSAEEKTVGKKIKISNVLRIIINFIMSPTILIYTALLFIYFITIVCKWSLPKGDIAYMVSAFVAVTLIGIVLQYVLPKRYYDWFYKNFTWIAIPPLVLYWIGTFHRIAQYGFTQGRVYLVIIGVLMTLFVLMLAMEKTKRFRAMLLIALCAIAVFTYIPGVSASSIGICSQTKRFEQKLSQFHLLDPATHKITDDIDAAKISNNPKLIKEYQEVGNIYDYLNWALGTKVMEQKYGKFNYEPSEDKTVGQTYDWKGTNIDLGDYSVMVQQDIKVIYNKDSIKVRSEEGDKILFSFPIGKYIKENPDILKDAQTHPEKILVFKNNSTMLVLGRFTIHYHNGKIKNLSGSDEKLFKKK
ncbi:MAG TPA: DUF4153 domain-containing protein [Candidatus Egerieousia sp.]|nr:DUF4153 domain-containing protein [Candidatus Egerieousia sp.]HPT06478.1 DUF4153 domain-containing protein [Candidatus Egerieousia sp.]